MIGNRWHKCNYVAVYRFFIVYFVMFASLYAQAPKPNSPWCKGLNSGKAIGAG